MTNMKMLHRYIICLGSNFQASEHLAAAREMIAALAGDVVWGDTLTTAAEPARDNVTYQNCAALLTTEKEIEEVKALFKDMERQAGRTPESKRLGIIPLDIDILTYDNQVIKAEDLRKKYVQLILRSLPDTGILTTLHTPV